MKNVLKTANNLKLNLKGNRLCIEVVIVMQQHFYNLLSGVKLCLRSFCFIWMTPVGILKDFLHAYGPKLISHSTTERDIYSTHLGFNLLHSTFVAVVKLNFFHFVGKSSVR